MLAPVNRALCWWRGHWAGRHDVRSVAQRKDLFGPPPSAQTRTPGLARRPPTNIAGNGTWEGERGPASECLAMSVAGARAGGIDHTADTAACPSSNARAPVAEPLQLPLSESGRIPRQQPPTAMAGRLRVTWATAAQRARGGSARHAPPQALPRPHRLFQALPMRGTELFSFRSSPRSSLSAGWSWVSTNAAMPPCAVLARVVPRMPGSAGQFDGEPARPGAAGPAQTATRYAAGTACPAPVLLEASARPSSDGARGMVHGRQRRRPAA